MSKWVRWFGVVVPVIALAFGSYAIAEDKAKPEAKPGEKKEEPKKDAPKPSDKPEVKKEEPKKEEHKNDKKAEAKTIVDVAMADKEFSTLVDLLKAAELVDTLKGEGPFTVFAPTNAAFDKLGKEMLEGLKKDKAKLGNILKYHVVKGKLMAADVLKLDGKTEKTLNEKGEIKIAVKDGKVTLDGKVNVTKTDIAASNGVIHVVDTVLMPAN